MYRSGLFSCAPRNPSELFVSLHLGLLPCDQIFKELGDYKNGNTPVVLVLKISVTLDLYY
jgi:hypothetical protein